MKTPDWYREAVASHGERVATGAENPADAAKAVAALLLEHPEFLACIAGRDVEKWAEKHGQGDLIQDGLFPALPVLMTVSPGVKIRTSDMTSLDLEKARVMLMTRTRNMAGAAKRQQNDFIRFYNAVRPHLKDDLTVGQVMPRLAAEKAA